jgi:hypothetical protein
MVNREVTSEKRAYHTTRVKPSVQSSNSFVRKSHEKYLETVSTGSGSDLVDRRRLYLKLTRSLSLPVLTVSK